MIDTENRVARVGMKFNHDFKNQQEIWLHLNLGGLVYKLENPTAKIYYFKAGQLVVSMYDPSNRSSIDGFKTEISTESFSNIKFFKKHAGSLQDAIPKAGDYCPVQFIESKTYRNTIRQRFVSEEIFYRPNINSGQFLTNSDLCKWRNRVLGCISYDEMRA